MNPNTVQWHIEQGHTVFEDQRGWEQYEFTARHGVIVQTSAEFVADDTAADWGCRDCRIDQGLEGADWIEERI